MGDKLEVTEVIACPHVKVTQNPLCSITLNVAVANIPSVYLVVEDSKIKLVCPSCLIKSLSGVA